MPADDALIDDVLDDLLADTPSAADAWAPPQAPEPAAEPPPPPNEAAAFVAASPSDTIKAELVIDPTTGALRQAGASAQGAFILQLREAAERDLYTFAKAILGRRYLTTALHKPICAWLTSLASKRRKMLLMPRETGKTTLIAHALPIHILIQPAEHNIYFPGESGAEQRIVLASKTEKRSKDALGVQRAAFESNDLLRALWPHRCWPEPRRDAPVWNNVEYTVPRPTAWPDPSVRAIGVGGAITGAHPSVLIKDDLINDEDANSPLVMEGAIEWHRVSRALINSPSALEFLIGTRWATHDLYSAIMADDPTVEAVVRHLIEDGRCIYPEGFSPTKIAELQATFGPMFMLLYMNSAADPLLTDFDLSQLRTYALDAGNGAIIVADDARDFALAARQQPNAPTVSATTSQALRGQSATRLFARDGRMQRRLEHLQLRTT